MRKKLYLFIFLSFSFLGGGVSYAGVTITGDRMLSDGNSSQSINGTYNNNSGEVTLTKIENIAAKNTVSIGQGSCNSIKAAINSMIVGTPTYDVWYTVGFFSCIETDFNKDGIKETVYIVNQKRSTYWGRATSRYITIILKQPQDQLILNGNFASQDYSINKKTILGKLVQKTLNGKKYFILETKGLYPRTWGSSYNYFSLLGSIRGNVAIKRYAAPINNGVYNQNINMIHFLKRHNILEIKNTSVTKYRYDIPPTRHWTPPGYWRYGYLLYTVQYTTILRNGQQLYYGPSTNVNLYQYKSIILNSGFFTETGGQLFAKSQYDNYFTLIKTINRMGFHSINVSGTIYFIGAYPTFQIFYDNADYMQTNTYTLYDANFNIVMNIGSTFVDHRSNRNLYETFGEQVFVPQDTKGFDAVITSKLGHSNWFLFEESGFIYIVDINTKKRYKVNVSNNRYGSGQGWNPITYMDYQNPTIVNGSSKYLLFRQYSGGSLFGGLIMLNENITFNSVSGTIGGVQEIKGDGIAGFPWPQVSWQGEIESNNQESGIMGIGKKIVKIKRSSPSSITFLTNTNWTRNVVRYGNPGTNAMAVTDLKDYTVYNLQKTYVPFNYSLQESQILFSFRKSDGLFMGYKYVDSTYYLHRCYAYYCSSGGDYVGIFSQGRSNDNYTGNVIERYYWGVNAPSNGGPWVYKKVKTIIFNAATAQVIVQ